MARGPLDGPVSTAIAARQVMPIDAAAAPHTLAAYIDIVITTRKPISHEDCPGNVNQHGPRNSLCASARFYISSIMRVRWKANWSIIDRLCPTNVRAGAGRHQLGLLRWAGRYTANRYCLVLPDWTEKRVDTSVVSLDLGSVSQVVLRCRQRHVQVAA